MLKRAVKLVLNLYNIASCSLQPWTQVVKYLIAVLKLQSYGHPEVKSGSTAMNSG